MPLTDSQRLKFRLFAEGLGVSRAARARLDELRGDRKLTPADYASTTGIILRLEDDVWVNAPLSDHNQNFVVAPRITLDSSSDGFHVHGEGLASRASVWLPPLYQDDRLPSGRPLSHFVFTHGDRARLSPIRGCAMRCRFCNVPYDDPYAVKPIDDIMEALRRAFCDPLQPARHLLISGGTPVARDVPWLRDAYERVLASFPHVPVDIMMTPVDDLLDLPRLKALGVHELSINIELHGADTARTLMPQKHRQGLDLYLGFIRQAAHVLGAGRVRSMLMVGLEPISDTLAGVSAILRAGGVPVLSPFRPSPATPLSARSPISASALEEVYFRAADLASSAGVELGPSCPPCTHNTLTLVPVDSAVQRHVHPEPTLV